MKRIALLLIGLSFFSRCVEAATYTPMPVKIFLTQYGINTHLQWASGYTDLPTVEAQINYIGATRVRDQPPSIASLNYYLQLYKDTGIKMTMNVFVPANDSYSSMLAFIKTNQKIFNRIGGCNEPDGAYPPTYGGFTGAIANVLFNKQLFQDITPLCIPLDTSPLINGSNIASYGPSPGCSTYDFHNYIQSSNSSSEFPYISQWINAFTAECPGKPFTMTEYGGWTTPCSDGLDYTVQAKYIINGLFDCEMLGGQECDIYELNDQQADPSCSTNEWHYGMFDAIGTAKTSGIILHNMATILSDVGQITPTTLDFNLVNYASLVPNGQKMLLQKSDGTYYIAIWNDSPVWNTTTHTDITVNPISVTLNLGITASIINVYDPLIGTSIQQTASSASSIVVSIPDHVILVNIRP